MKKLSFGPWVLKLGGRGGEAKSWALWNPVMSEVEWTECPFSLPSCSESVGRSL